jgi:hypothetical protein
VNGQVNGAAGETCDFMPGFRIAAGEARKLIGELAPPQASFVRKSGLAKAVRAGAANVNRLNRLSRRV